MKKTRWMYSIIGVLVMLFAGLVYAWSVLARPIGGFFTTWSSTQLSFTFTLCMMFFCLGGLITGILSKKYEPKLMLKVSAMLFLIGFVVSSRSNSIITLYIGYGVIAGLASGIAYNSIMGNITKFFPDCPGLISGILLMGFGFGSFIIGKVYQSLTPSGAGVDKWRTSFLVFGIILFAVIFVASFIVRKPNSKEIKEISKLIVKDGNDKEKEEINLTPHEMLKEKSFWLFFTWAILLSAAGLAIVSQASGIVMEVDKNCSAGTVSTVVGLISIFNGGGRVIFGGLFDKIGRLKTMMLNNILFVIAIVVIMLSISTKQFSFIILGFIAMGLSYGGVTPTNSAFVSAFYGSKNYSVNLSLVNMNLLIASFGSTIAGSLYDSSGSYFSTLIAMIAAVVVGTVITFMIRENKKIVE